MLGIESQILELLKEDDLGKNLQYQLRLPQDPVSCELRVKEDCLLSGLPFFYQVFKCLGADIANYPKELEGMRVKKGDVLLDDLKLPFSMALTGERLALNLLQRSSSISTLTAKFVEKARKYNIEILDTRKTTPGLRFLEKYAVVVGGGKNHRLGQTDMWMIKDNHKTFFGGVTGAYNFFKSVGSFYNPLLLEVHEESEIAEGKKLGIKHFMLDNFSSTQFKSILKLKESGMTYEISGGVTLDNIDNYLIEGIDAISIGALTHSVPVVDLSFKYKRLH
jgi:nicotinate-nucleotide pyrophosphorylase (carboxylating)